MSEVTAERVAHWQGRYEVALTRRPPHLVVTTAEWENELRTDATPQTATIAPGAATRWAGADVYVDICPFGCCAAPPPDAHPFIDLVSHRPVTLHMGDEPGVEHPDCDYRAEVFPELDAFFCRHCGRNGRISGAWFMDLLAAREAAS